MSTSAPGISLSYRMAPEAESRDTVLVTPAPAGEASEVDPQRNLRIVPSVVLSALRVGSVARHVQQGQSEPETVAPGQLRGRSRSAGFHDHTEPYRQARARRGIVAHDRTGAQLGSITARTGHDPDSRRDEKRSPA